MPQPLNPLSHAARRRDPDPLTDAIDLALTSPPAIYIPADFAAHVAALAAAEAARQSAVVLPTPRYARAALLLSTVAVLLVLLSFTPSVLAHNFSQVLAFTWLLCAEAVLLAAALGPWREPWTSSR